MDYERLKTEYLCFLMNRVQVRGAGLDGYSKLCQYLNTAAFIPIVPYDENRTDDCRELRREFSEEYFDILNSLLPYSGSIMELLVVLTDRICYETEGSRYHSLPSKWFLEMLNNCGLGRCDNVNFDLMQDRREISMIIERINMRLYGFSGYGGLFPLKLPRTDQRHEELMTQMNNYIEENYDFT